MKYQKFIIVFAVLAFAACRSGHFEKNSVPTVPQSIERQAAPNPEIISVIAEDVSSKSFTEKSTQVTEVGILVRLQARSSRETPLKQRKLFYEVSFLNDPQIPTFKDSTTTDETGKILLNLTTPFYKLEDERIQVIKINFRFAKHADEKTDLIPSAELSLPLDFDANPMKPLLPLAALSVNHLRGEQKRLILSGFNFAEEVSRSNFRIDHLLSLKYIPFFAASAQLNITRMRFGKIEPELAPLVQSKIRGKIFAYDRSSDKIKIIYEKFLDLSSDDRGRIQFSAEPEWSDSRYRKENIRWIFAFEFPELPKVARSFFIFDPVSSQLSPLTDKEAVEKLGQRAFDIGIPLSPQKTLRPVINDYFRIFQTAQNLGSPDPSFEEALLKLIRSPLDIFKMLAEKFQISSEALKKMTMSEMYFIQNIENQLLKEQKKDSLIFTGKEGDLRFEREMRIFELKGVAKKCLVFFMGPSTHRDLRYRYCFQQDFSFHTSETWQFYYSTDRPDLKFLVRGQNRMKDLEALKDADVWTHPISEWGVFTEQIYP